MGIFPAKAYGEAGAFCDDYLAEMARAAGAIDRAAFKKAAGLLAETVKRRGTVFACGNGGSAAIANHLTCDCLKGAQTGTLLKPKVHSLSANIEVITAIANDFAYEQIFSYQLATLAEPGDLLITISSSGNSPNILAALDWARANGVASIAMSGFDGGGSPARADVSLHVAAENYGVVEDLHQSLMHMLAQFLRLGALTDPSTLGKVKF